MDFRSIIKRYNHAWVLIYFVIYSVWFAHLEKTVTSDYAIIYTKIDDYIPFSEYFIIPYYLWFIFIFFVFVYFFFTSKPEFYKLCGFLMTGMTVFLLISTFYPNGQNLRPTEFDSNTIFTQLVSYLYSMDTPTNVFPSIHVFNTIGAQIAIMSNTNLQKYKWIQVSTFILSVLIIISTVTLKQHSIIDTIGAFILAAPLYVIIYGRATDKGTVHSYKKKKEFDHEAN